MMMMMMMMMMTSSESLQKIQAYFLLYSAQNLIRVSRVSFSLDSSDLPYSGIVGDPPVFRPCPSGVFRFSVTSVRNLF